MLQCCPCRYGRCCHCHSLFGSCLCAASWALISLLLYEGALPLVVAFLDQSRAEVHAALQILHRICVLDPDPTSLHADLLARLQGIRRLSNIFCIVRATNLPAEVAGLDTSFVPRTVDQPVPLLKSCRQIFPSNVFSSTIASFAASFAHQSSGGRCGALPASPCNLGLASTYTLLLRRRRSTAYNTA